MASITRIQNNQITDSTIIGYSKIGAQTLTGNLFASSLTYAGNLTILGNLYTSGNATTINSTNTYVDDPLITFNYGYGGSLSGFDIGMYINRNQTSLANYGSVNTAWVWVENDQAFEAIATATQPLGGITTLTPAGYVNVKLGNLTTTGSATINNSLTVGAGIQNTPIGSTTANTGAFTTLTAGSFQGIIGNVATNNAFFATANAGVFNAATIGNIGTMFYGNGFNISALNASNLQYGNVPTNVVNGFYDNITGVGALGNLTVTNWANLNTVSASGITANLFGNAGAYFYGTLTASSSNQANILVVGNLTSLSVAGVHTNWGNVVAASGTASTSTTTGAIVVTGTGGAGIGGDVFVGGNIHGNIGATVGGNVFIAANLVPTVGSNASLGSWNQPFAELYLSGSTLVLGGSTFSVDAATGGIYVTPNTNVTANPFTFVFTPNGTVTTTTTTGGTPAAGAVTAAVQTATFQTILPNIKVSSGVTATNVSGGALQVVGGAGVTGNIYGGALYDAGSRVVSTSTGAGNLTITGNTVNLTTSGPGAVQFGGITQMPVVATDTYGRVSTASNIALNTIVVTQAGNTANITANNSVGQVGFDLTNSGVTPGVYGSSAYTPQFTVDNKGRVISVSNVAINAIFTVAGTSGSTTIPTNSTFSFASTNGVTIAVGAEYANISTPQDVRVTANPTFNNLVTASIQGNIGNVTQYTGQFTTLQASGVTQITNTTPTTGASTGALQVTGGASVGGNLYVAGNFTVAGTATYINTTTEIVSGTEVVAGVLTANSGTLATTTTSGALQVTNGGGAGISGNLYAGNYVGPIGSYGLANTATFTSVTTTGNINAGNVIAASFQGVIGNVTPSPGYFTTLTATSSLNIAALNGTIIGNVTPAPGTFTTLTATNNVIALDFQGVIGNISPNAAFFTTANATNLYAATIGNLSTNLYGTIQTPSQTNITAVGTLNGLTVASGYNVLINGTANNNALSYASGALQVAGGAGFASNVYIGGNLTVAGNITTSLGNINVVTVSGNSAQFFGNLAGFGALYAGINAGYVVQPQTVIQASTNFNGYAQVNHQNINGGANASTDFIATADNGTATSGYVDMGINSSGFVGGTGNELNYPLDGYLYVQGTTGTNGNLLLGTGNAADIVFSTGGFSTTNNYQGRFKNGVGLILAQPTAAINTTSGALQVAGGVGVIGNVYAGNFIGPVGTTTSANTGIFTSLTATSNIADNGGGLTTTASTGYLFNDTATTLNIGSAAATVNMGSTSGTLALNNPTINTSVTSGTLALFNTGLTGTLNVAGAASAINIGSASSTLTFAGTTLTGTNTATVNLNGTNPTIATTNTGTVSLFNTNALTVNAFGAATTIGIGNASGTTTIQGITKHTGNVLISSGTSNARYSTTSGALVIPTGGAGIAGNVTIGGALFIGSQPTYNPVNSVVSAGYNVNGYAQFAIQNASSGSNASTDIAVVANNGSDNDTFIDMGITSSTYSQSGYSLYNPNDGYLIVSGNATTGGGNIIVNTYSANDIIFATGGTNANNEVARITHGNVFVVKSTNNATPAANIGAVQVWGGASITGNTYHGGASTFNGSQASGNEFYVKGVNDSTLLWVHPNSSYDQVVIGGSMSVGSLPSTAKLIINSTDSMVIPTGTSGQRPGTGVTGAIRFNSTINAIEYWNGSNWVTPNTTITAITDQIFNGDGSTVNFTLTQASTTYNCIVSINGVVQIPGASYAYTVSGTTLTFTQAPATGDVIDVRVLTTLTTATELLDQAGGYNSVVAATGTGIQFTTGNIGANLQYTMSTNGAMVTNSPNVAIGTSGASSIDVFPTNAYSSAKYLITATNLSTGARQISEVMVVSDGATSANIATISSLTSPSSANWVSFSASYASGNVTLTATTSVTNTNYRIKRDYQAI